MTEKRCCANCRYVLNFIAKGEIKGALLCRHSPPMAIGVPIQGRGGSVSIAIQTADRPVGPDYWCHQFLARTVTRLRADELDYEEVLLPMDEESGNRVS